MCLINFKFLAMAKPISRAYNEDEGRSINLINKGTKIVGDITAEGDIRIDGELIGNIKAKGRLVIGTNGVIEGEILCRNIEVSGKVKGKISAMELLTMKASSKINGEITSAKLTVEPGAVFTGTCKMGGEPAKNDSAKTK
ncbi:hypothetical protein MNBD_BACTEROID01-1309 [hydrothermal vent metagenome]|uniref:Polymer-forming cytoskeletal protein n=1 Tax=hydrothermal vent metagenome TaxID=652676 RepID=A0A3B0U5Z1_9ZZZZ